MELANIVLKLDKIGTNTPLKNVTPAEVMLLVADHHTNAGGNPIEKCQIISPKVEQTAIEVCEAELEKIQEKLTALDEQELTDEIRERRQKSLLEQQTRFQEELARVQAIVARRNGSSLEERVRLIGRYGKKRVMALFPGGLPTFPATFKEAIQGGIGAEPSQDKLIVTVGDTGAPITG